MKVRFYGRLADAIGREVEIDSEDGRSIGEVRAAVAALHPAAASELRRSRAFIRDSMAEDDRRTAADDIPEFLPPVSGG